MKIEIRIAAWSLALIGCAVAHGADWITAPSYYTHDPQSGRRVDQYTPIGPVYTFARTDFMRSGYRHTQSVIQAGQSADYMHIVEEWGRPVRPYGEWQFPFRPYSVPYPLWGPPFGGLGGGNGWGNGWGSPGPGPEMGMEYGADPYGRQQPPPYYDDDASMRRRGPSNAMPRGPFRSGRGGPNESMHDGAGH